MPNDNSPTVRIRPKLIPVSVPWQIDGRASLLTLLTSESPREQPTELFLHAYVLGENRSAPLELHQIKIAFGEPTAARLYPVDTDDSLLYDTSALRPTQAVDNDLGALIRASEAEWRRSGACPDPGFYEVRGDSWASELRLDADEGLKHYRAVGRYGAIEVLAKSWKWQTLRALPDAPSPLGPPLGPE